jgi:hypothetical protein
MEQLSEGDDTMRRLITVSGLILLLGYCMVLTGCSGNVGVGVGVSVPVGDHGRVSVGGSTWR